MPNIVIFNPIMNDGIGDFVHWQELEPMIRDHFGNDCSICSFIVLQAGNHKNEERIKQLVEEFNEATDSNQSQAIILEYPENIDEAVNKFKTLLESNTELLEKIKSCDAIIDLPLPCGLRWVLKDYIPGDFPPTTCITAIDEAGVTTLHNYGPVIYDNYYEMTLTNRERKLNQEVLLCGVKFKKDRGLSSRETAINSLNLLVEANEHQALNKIFGINTDDDLSVESTVDSFLEENHFIPAFFQDSNYMVAFIYSLAINKSLAAEGKNIVFFVNNIGSVFSSGRRGSKFLREYGDLVEEVQIGERLEELGVSKIIIDSKEGIREILISHSNSRKIYIITDCRIENDLAYKSIYGIAQTIAGCSGDNTLEEVLSRGLLPFFQISAKKQEPSVRELTTLCRQFSDNKDVEQLDSFVTHLMGLIGDMYKPNKVEIIQNIDIVAAAPLIRKLSNRVFNDEDYMYLNFYNHLPSILNSALIRSRNLSPPAIRLAFKALSNAPVAGEMLVGFLISRTSKPTFLIKDTVEVLKEIIKQIPADQQAIIQPYIDEHTTYDEFYKNHKDGNNQNFFQHIDTTHMNAFDAFDKKRSYLLWELQNIREYMSCFVNQGNCNDIANQVLRAIEEILDDLFVLTGPLIEDELASSMNQLLTLVREHDPENGIQTLRDIEKYIEEISTLLDDVNFERRSETEKAVISSFSQFKGRFFSHKPDDSDVSFVRQFTLNR